MPNLCAGTPKITVRDNRGLDVRTLRYNRGAEGAVAAQYVDAYTHNALGQLLSSQDPRFFGGSILNFRHTPALSGQVLETVSADAGTSRACADIAGRPFWHYSQGRDSQLRSDNAITVCWYYDALGRPVQRVRATAPLAYSTSVTPATFAASTTSTTSTTRGGLAGMRNVGACDLWFYGEANGQPGDTYDPLNAGDPRNANQRGQLLQHFDTAGLLDMSVLGYGVQGQPLRQDRSFLALACDPDNNWMVSDNKPPFIANKSLLEGRDPYDTCWTHNALAQVLTQTDAQGHQQHTAYDCAGRKYSTAVTPKGGNRTLVTTAIAYTAADEIDTRGDANGIQVAYAYEPQMTGRLVSITASRISESRSQIDTRRKGHVRSSMTRLQALAYTYDGVGNVTALSDDSAGAQVTFFRNRVATPDRSYAYDALYQLTNASGRENYVDSTPKGTDWPGGNFKPSTTPDYRPYTRAYTYDLGGNLTSIGSADWTGATPPTRNVVVSRASNRAVCTANYQGPTPDNIDNYFDGAGKNICVDGNPNQPMYWTPLHQLYCVVTAYRSPNRLSVDWNNSDREQYAYDGAGQRIRKYGSSKAGGIWNHTDARYLPGLELRNDTGTGEQLEVIVLNDGARILNWPNGTPKPADIPSLQLRYQYSDRQHAVLIETDQDGNLITREEYYPYGGTSVLTSRSDIEVKYKFIRYSGKERDVTGFYYYGLRYYQPWTGRWISPDPAGAVNGQNLYCMVRNNPVTLRDRAGTMADGKTPEEATSRKSADASPGGSRGEAIELPPAQVPKQIHYVWLGKAISAEHMTNILLVTAINPDYKINMWTDRPKSILATFDAMLQDTGHPLHRYLAHWHRDAFSRPPEGGDARINLGDVSSVFESLRASMPGNRGNDKGQALPGDGTKAEALFLREKNGAYRNYAAASDIARYATLIVKGGIYMDVDVVPPRPLGTFSPPRGMVFNARNINNIFNIERNNDVIGAVAGSSLARTLIPTVVSKYAEFDQVFSEHLSVRGHPPALEPWMKGIEEPASWSVKRASTMHAEFQFGRRLGTMTVSGPEVLDVITNRFASFTPRDLFPPGTFGARYRFPSAAPASREDAGRQLNSLAAAPLPPRAAVVWEGWFPRADARGAWVPLRGLRRSSI
ncbi:hypothetical protein CAL29_11175 [Bordetella genomosp. 10]|uniref:Toxin n=1 Tax=Bordetella genomosp. 10 TaxID=1416804 RepID=A0A261SBF7_9BORD|nr:RHS repeat-associated core domain-containing protein [Bordetella genomosp. 10]OZI34110.1 hypothetical protein CAL29_11175 [Bordetella genomosp. 10]